eukprot:7380262-Prymnesium_polylepis.1
MGSWYANIWSLAVGADFASATPPICPNQACTALLVAAERLIHPPQHMLGVAPRGARVGEQHAVEVFGWLPPRHRTQGVHHAPLRERDALSRRVQLLAEPAAEDRGRIEQVPKAKLRREGEIAGEVELVVRPDHLCNKSPRRGCDEV